jgi:hypothetical protein
MATSSSAKKVAKLASRGKGKKVRFQGGTLFPAVVVLVVVLGLLSIVYARQSRPADGSGSPRVGDHWHAAFGMYVCDTYEPKLIGNKEEGSTDPSTGNRIYDNVQFGLTGIHSHDDGIMHWHPYSSKSSGNRARLGVFLKVYGIKLSESEVSLPDDQGGDSWSTKDTKCDGKDTVIKVIRWDNYADSGSSETFTSNLNDVRLTKNGQVFVIAIVPKDTDVPLPPWAPELPTLGAADDGNVPTTVDLSATTVATTDTTTGDATTADTTGDTTSTAPATLDSAVTTTTSK